MTSKETVPQKNTLEEFDNNTDMSLLKRTKGLVADKNGR